MADSFVFYRSFAENIAKIPDADTQFKFYKALIAFGLDDVKTDFEYPLDLFFDQMCTSISSAKAKHDKRVKAGKKGGMNGKGKSRNKGNSNAKSKANNSKTIANNSKTIANNSKTIPNVNGNDNVNEVITINMDNDLPPVCAPLIAAQPSVTWEVTRDENGQPRFIKHEYGGNGET